VTSLAEFKKVRATENWSYCVIISDDLVSAIDVVQTKRGGRIKSQPEVMVDCSNPIHADLVASICHLFAKSQDFIYRIHVVGLPMSVVFGWANCFDRVVIKADKSYSVGMEARENGLTMYRDAMLEVTDIPKEVKTLTCLAYIRDEEVSAAHVENVLKKLHPSTKLVLDTGGLYVQQWAVDIPLLRWHPRVEYVVDDGYYDMDFNESKLLTGDVNNWLHDPFTRKALLLAGTHVIPERYRESALRLLSRDLLRVVVEAME
jgi:hypothetical protein